MITVFVYMIYSKSAGAYMADESGRIFEFFSLRAAQAQLDRIHGEGAIDAYIESIDLTES